MSQPENQSQSNKARNYWPMVSLLIVVMAIAIGYFLLYPSMKDLGQLNIQIAAREKEAEALEEKINDLSALQKAFSGKQEEIDKLDLALPKDDAMAQLLNQINSIGLNSGLSIVSVDQKKSTKGTKYTPVEVGFEGSYKSLELFLADLEKNIRAGDSKQISISSSQSQEGEKQDIIKGKVDIDFFKVGGAKLTNKNKETFQNGTNNNTE